MKGIILAGGSGSRLFPITKGVSKQILPIYDKPMIYYPLSTLINSGINEVLIISTPNDINSFQRLLGNGTKLGLKLQYAIQEKPDGIAEAFLIGEKFIKNDNVCLILGDNIFYGQDFDNLINRAKENIKINQKATIFGYYVDNPKRYGVVEFNENNIISIEEKPKNPKSNYVVSGLYFYPNSVVEVAKQISPSKRGELEISCINNYYLKQGNLKLLKFSEGFVWLDAGTHDSLFEAASLIKTIEKRQGRKIGCIEESAYNNGFISKSKLKSLGEELSITEYGKYILKICNQ